MPEKKPPVFAMKTAKSTNVHQHGYDPSTRTLRVHFHSGSVYDYHDVPPEVASDFEKAKSVGSFMAVSVRNKFKSSLVSAKPAKT